MKKIKEIRRNVLCSLITFWDSFVGDIKKSKDGIIYIHGPRHVIGLVPLITAEKFNAFREDAISKKPRWAFSVGRQLTMILSNFRNNKNLEKIIIIVSPMMHTTPMIHYSLDRGFYLSEGTMTDDEIFHKILENSKKIPPETIFYIPILVKK